MASVINPYTDDVPLRIWRAVDAGVSAAAIIMRLKALELLDEDGTLMLFKRRSARWGAKSEPGDEDRLPEQPRLLRRTIDLLVEEKVMPLEAIPRHIGLAARDVEALIERIDALNAHVQRLSSQGTTKATAKAPARKAARKAAPAKKAPAKAARKTGRSTKAA